MHPRTLALLASFAVAAVCGGGADVAAHQDGNETDVVNQQPPRPQQGTVADFIKSRTDTISPTDSQDITGPQPDPQKRKKRTICLSCVLGKKLGGFGGGGGCGGGGCGGGGGGLIPVPVPVAVPVYGGGGGGGCGHPGCGGGGGVYVPSGGGGCGSGGCGGGGGYQQITRPVEVKVPVKVSVVPVSGGGGGGCPTGGCYQPAPQPVHYVPSGCGGGGCNPQPQVCSTCGGGGGGASHSFSQASSQASSSSYSSGWGKK